jgi:hypothetical protein
VRDVKFPCPCCEYLTLGHPADGSFDICPVCFWEDDPVQNRDPLFWGGANEPSLIDAKINFARFGACEERVLPFVRAPLPEEVPPGR